MSDAWSHFNDDPQNHLKISGYCSHCRNLVTHHRKNADVKKHLERCLQFKELMNATEINDRPVWYAAVKKAKLTSSTLDRLQVSGTSEYVPLT